MHFLVPHPDLLLTYTSILTTYTHYVYREGEIVAVCMLSISYIITARPHVSVVQKGTYTISHGLLADTPKSGQPLYSCHMNNTFGTSGHLSTLDRACPQKTPPRADGHRNRKRKSWQAFDICCSVSLSVP